MARILRDKEIKDIAVDIITRSSELKSLSKAELENQLKFSRSEYSEEDLKSLEDELVTFYNIDIKESNASMFGTPVEKPGQLVKGQTYVWTGGAELLDIQYIGLAIKNPNIKPGSSMGKGFIFQWADNGRYMELSMQAIRQNVILKEDVNESAEGGGTTFDESEPEYEIKLVDTDIFVAKKAQKIAQDLGIEGSATSSFIIGAKTMLKKFINLLKGFNIKVESILDGHNAEVSLESIPVYGKPGRPTNKYNYPNRMRNEAKDDASKVNKDNLVKIGGILKDWKESWNSKELNAEAKAVGDGGEWIELATGADHDFMVYIADGEAAKAIDTNDSGYTDFLTMGDHYWDKDKKDFAIIAVDKNGAEHLVHYNGGKGIDQAYKIMDGDSITESAKEKPEFLLTEKKLFDSIFNMKPKDRKMLLDEVLKIPVGQPKDRVKKAASVLIKKPAEYKKALQMMMPSVHQSVYEVDDAIKFPMICECDSNELIVNPLHEALKSGKKLNGIKIKKEFEDDSLPCVNAVAMVGGKRFKFSDWYLERKVLKKYHQAEGGDKGALQGVRNRLVRYGNEFIKEYKNLQKELKAIDEAEAAANKSVEQKFTEWLKEKKFKLYVHLWEKGGNVYEGLFLAERKPKKCFDSYDNEELAYNIGYSFVGDFDSEYALEKQYKSGFPWDLVSLEEAIESYNGGGVLTKLMEQTMEHYPKDLSELLGENEQRFDGGTTNEAIFDLGSKHANEAADDDYFEVENRLKDVCFQFHQQQIDQGEAVAKINEILEDSKEVKDIFKDVVPEALVDAIIEHYDWSMANLSEGSN